MVTFLHKQESYRGCPRRAQGLWILIHMTGSSRRGFTETDRESCGAPPITLCQLSSDSYIPSSPTLFHVFPREREGISQSPSFRQGKSKSFPPNIPQNTCSITEHPSIDKNPAFPMGFAKTCRQKHFCSKTRRPEIPPFPFSPCPTAPTPT